MPATRFARRGLWPRAWETCPGRKWTAPPRPSDSPKRNRFVSRCGWPEGRDAPARSVPATEGSSESISAGRTLLREPDSLFGFVSSREGTSRDGTNGVKPAHEIESRTERIVSSPHA
jgi:hypothetical protein